MFNQYWLLLPPPLLAHPRVVVFWTVSLVFMALAQVFAGATSLGPLPNTGGWPPTDGLPGVLLPFVAPATIQASVADLWCGACLRTVR